MVLISRGAATAVLPGEDPIGKHLTEVDGLAGGGVWEVIGVVGDVRWSVSQPPMPTLYWPVYGNGYSFATIVVRAPTTWKSLAVPVQKIVAHLDPDLPVST